MIIHNCEQGSVEWYELRLGKVTGTRLKEVMKDSNICLVDELIGEMLSQQIDDDGYVSPEMQRGKDLEPLAVEQYCQHRNVTVERVGFIQSVRWPLLGMSPDAIMGKEGGVETKCPSSKKHIQYLRQQQLPNDYKWQVICPFLINPDCQWWDFVSFDPRISQRPMFIHRTYREDVLKDINNATDKLEKFFTKLEEYKSEILFPSLTPKPEVA